MIGLRFRLRAEIEGRQTAPSCLDEVLTKAEARWSEGDLRSDTPSARSGLRGALFFINAKYKT
jgi:hypothetical protein